MPYILAFLLYHASVGVLVACGVLGAVLVTDFGGIGTLIRAFDGLIFSILLGKTALLCAALQVSVRVILMGEERDP